MNIQEKVNKYISEGKTKAEAINLAYDEKPKMQSGGTVDMYGSPINAPIQHKDIPRSFYDSRRGLINLGNDYKNMSPQQQEKVVAHENRHAWQYKNDRSNFQITHNPEFAFNERLQKKPNIINTDEVFNNYNNRQQKETDLELDNIKKQNPQFSFMPNQILYDKGFSDGLYDNKFALEGEAQYYENTGQKSFQQGGTWENQILKNIQKRNEQIYLEAQNYPRNKPLDINSEEYKKAYDDYNVFNYDKNTDTYIGRELEEVVIPQKKGFWEQSRDKYLEEHKDDGVLGAIGSVVTYPLAVGQDAMMYGLTGKVQTPTEGLGIRKGMEGVAGSVFNMAADPANLIGAGILTKESLLEKIAMSKESGLLSNAYKLNPNAFKPNSNSFYRQIDNTTYNEGLESGLIRGKQDIDMTSGEGTINLNKAFGDDAYYNKAVTSLENAGTGELVDLYRVQKTGQIPGMSQKVHIENKIKNGEPLTYIDKGYLKKFEESPYLKGTHEGAGRWFTSDPSALDYYKRDLEGDPMEVLKYTLPKKEAEKFNVSNFDNIAAASADVKTEYTLPDELIKKAERMSMEDWLQGYKQVEVPKPNVNYNSIFDEEGITDFMQILKNKKEADRAIEMAKADLIDPETIKRASELGINTELLEQASNNMTYTTLNSSPSSFNSADFSININPKQIGRSNKQEMIAEIMGDLSPNFTANEIASHEIGHVFQNTPLWKEGYKKTVPNDIKKMLKFDTPENAKKIRSYWENYSTRDSAPTKVDNLLGNIDFKKNIKENTYTSKNKSYFENANNKYGTNIDNSIERLPMFREYRQGLRDSGILKNKWDEITPEIIDEYYKLKPENRLNSFMAMTEKNKKLIREVSKIAPVVTGASYLATQRQEDLPRKKQGGTINYTKDELAFLEELNNRSF